MEKYFKLVSFTKQIDGCVVDIQYHVFEVAAIYDVSFVHDELFRSFMDKGYTWSAVVFPEILAYSCGFTISKVGE